MTSRTDGATSAKVGFDRSRVSSPRRIPGEVGLWILLLGEMTFFAYALIIYLSYRSRYPGAFRASQDLLHPGIAAVNTFMLLASSFLVVLAVEALRAGQNRAGSRFLSGAIACGLVFILLKGIEYHDEISNGAAPGSNIFFTFYFFLTGVHLLHVVAGLCVLAYLLKASGRPGWLPRHVILLEGGTCYWHMVDCVWMLIFPLFYLIR